MDKNKILKNINAVDVLNKMPKIFIEQFVKLSCYYLAYIDIETPSVADRTDYINESFNAMTLLNKLIATASNGKKIESQVKVPEQARFPYDDKKSTEDTIQSPPLRFGTQHDSIPLEEYLKMTQVSTKDNDPNVVITAINPLVSTEDKYYISSDDNRVSSSNKLSVSNNEESPLNEIKDQNDNTNNGDNKDFTIKNTLPTFIETENTVKDGENIMATKKTTTTSKKSTTTAKKQSVKKTPTTARQVFTTELKNWGIDSESFAYAAMVAVSKVCSKNDTPIDAIHKVANHLGKSVPTTASAFAALVKKADFSKAEFVPKLKRLSNVTKETLLTEYLAFCK